jgi:hypothetical protein
MPKTSGNAPKNRGIDCQKQQEEGRTKKTGKQQQNRPITEGRRRLF